MIENLHPQLRRKIAGWIAQARQGNLSTVLGEVTIQAAIAGQSAMDRVAVLSLKAHLLHLDLQNDPALAVYRDEIDPLLPHVPRQVALTVADNGALMSLRAHDHKSGQQFYEVADKRHAEGHELWDAAAILEADEASRAGKSYDALPIYWRELRRAYLSGSLRAIAKVSERMATECCRTGHHAEGLFHAISSRDDDAVRNAVASISLVNVSNIAEECVSGLLATSRLNAHARAACGALVGLAEIVPPKLIHQVVVWMLDLMKIDSREARSQSLFTAACEVLVAIAPQCPVETAQTVLAVSVDHATWGDTPYLRRHLAEVINEYVRVGDNALGEPTLLTIVERVVPFVTDRKDNIDYVANLNLLATCADIGPKTVKDRIRQVLYQPAVGLTPLLIRTADRFGVRSFDPSQLTKFCRSATQAIRLQVQRLGAGTEPVPPKDNILCATHPRSEGSLVVYHSNGQFLRALEPHRVLIEKPSLEEMAEAMVELAVDSDNAVGNKVLLLDSLGQFLDALPDSVMRTIYESLMPLTVRGAVRASDLEMSDLASHPLSRARFFGGCAGDVVGGALRVLGACANRLTRPQAKAVERGIAISLIDADEEVRCGACVAVSRLGYVTRSMLPGLLANARDPSQAVVGAAWYALLIVGRKRLGRSEWDLLISTVEQLSQSSDIGRRRVAASVVRRLCQSGYLADPNLLARVSELKLRLETDVAYSVRRNATECPPRAENDAVLSD